MKKTNALALRQNLGKIVRELHRTGEPIMIEKARTPVAVMITIEDYQRRFVDKQATDSRKQIVDEIRNAKLVLPKGITSLELIRNQRA